MDFAIPYARGFRQLETYALGISDAILMVIAIKFMLDRKHTLLVILIFTCLIALSFFSFFSDWKGPLSILLVASLTGIRTFNVRQALRLSPIVLPAFLLLFVWQSIKGEYRAYLNEANIPSALWSHRRMRCSNSKNWLPTPLPPTSSMKDRSMQPTGG